MKEKKEKRSKRINWFKYFLMKWRYRVDQSRAIFTLLTFAALLAVTYVEYLSFLNKLGFWGVVIFTFIILLAFMIGGYLYDVVMKLWKANMRVNVERNPYTYAPSPKEFIAYMGRDMFLYNSLLQISEKLGIELAGKEEIINLLKKYYALSIENPDLEKDSKEVQKISEELQKLFMKLNEQE